MVTGTTLILDAFWVDNKYFPTLLCANSNEGQAFYDYYYGEARHLGWMDLCLLKPLIKKHKITHIILQNLEAFGQICDAIGEVKVCIAYNYNKFHVVHSVDKIKELTHCEPIYATVEFGGWDFPEDGKLHFRAQTYIRYLLIHTRVNSITCFTNKFEVTASFDSKGQIEFHSQPI